MSSLFLLKHTVSCSLGRVVKVLTRNLMVSSRAGSSHAGCETFHSNKYVPHSIATKRSHSSAPGCAVALYNLAHNIVVLDRVASTPLQRLAEKKLPTDFSTVHTLKTNFRRLTSEQNTDFRLYVVALRGQDTNTGSQTSHRWRM